MAKRNLAQRDVSQLNDMAIFLSFKITPILKRFLTCPHKTVALFTGNQFGKTAGIAYGTVLSIMGRHPVPEKNLDYFRCDCGGKWNSVQAPKDGKCPKCGGEVKLWCSPIRVIRFASETLPGETTDGAGGQSTETKNTQYPAFKKWCPPFLIKKDITARSPKLVVKSMLSGQDVVVEFVSYNQSVQSTAGQQRWKVACDEEPPKAFYEEQLPRLLAADGFFELSLTPANYISWTHDDLYDRASVYYRSETIANKYGVKQVEKIRDDNAIAVIQAATDDNATLQQDVIERLFENYDDPDVIAIRRYGIFKQVSGRIFKAFDWSIHVVDERKVFPEGVPQDGFHARAIDYHERTPWAVGWFYLSSTDELFIYDEYNPSPEHMVTLDISREIANRYTDYKYRLDLIDPLAQKAQVNTGVSVVDDLNRHFLTYKRDGLGSGAFWQPWDTKSTRGRDAAIERLKNSALVGKPFCNSVMRNGKTVYLPTLWILSRCKSFANSFKNWRWDEWANATSQAIKEEKNTPQQRWSHFPMTVEALLKDSRFRPLRGGYWGSGGYTPTREYFKRERAHA